MKCTKIWSCLSKSINRQADLCLQILLISIKLKLRKPCKISSLCEAQNCEESFLCHVVSIFSADLLIIKLKRYMLMVIIC